MDDQRRLVYVRLETAGKLTQAKRRILELAKLLPATARKLQSDPGHSFAGNAVVEQINTLIEQRCALTIRRLTDPAAENDAAAEPSI